MLTTIDMQKLKSHANTIESKYQVGKNGLTNNNLILLDKALEAHELIKVSVLKNADKEINEIAFDISSNINCEIVQIVGRVITFYRKSKKPGIKHIL